METMEFLSNSACSGNVPLWIALSRFLVNLVPDPFSLAQNTRRKISVLLVIHLGKMRGVLPNHCPHTSRKFNINSVAIFQSPQTLPTYVVGRSRVESVDPSSCGRLFRNDLSGDGE